MIQALTETPIGRALLAYWEDLPLWTLANVLLALALLPVYLAWLLVNARLAITISWPASLVFAGIANTLGRSVQQKAPRFRDFLGGPRVLALSAWVVLAALAMAFTFPQSKPVFVLCCVAAVVFLLITPLSLCVSVFYPTGVYQSWWNGFVLAVHAPLVAVGLLALGGILGWVLILSKGALMLIVPVLWMMVTMVSAQEILSTIHIEDD